MDRQSKQHYFMDYPLTASCFRKNVINREKEKEVRLIFLRYLNTDAPNFLIWETSV